jgi:hypothetical protein
MESNMGAQKEFDYDRGAKFNALERIACPGGATVKALLWALESFEKGNPTSTVTISILMERLQLSRSTVKRARFNAEAAGLLDVYGCPEDGQANTYRINWNEVFNLPGAENSTRRVRPRSKERIPQVNLNHPPVQIGPGPGSKCTGTQVKMNRAPATSSTATTASVRKETQTANGGGFEEKEPANKPRGWWAWRITRDDLGNNDEMVKFFKAAVSANVITDTKINRVRFVALTIHTQRQEKLSNVCGYMVTHIERGSWNYLAKDAVRDAVRKVNLQLTPDELAEVRQASGMAVAGPS